MGKRAVDVYNDVCVTMGFNGMLWLQRKTQRDIEKYLRKHLRLSYYQSKNVAFLIKH